MLRYMANIFGLVLLAAPFVESVDRSSLGAALWMVMLFCLFVYLTVVNTAKRLHDLNVSAWFAPLVINPIGFIVLLVLSGTDGPNKYGSKP